MLNLPNLLSVFRIVLVPVLVVVLLTKFHGKELVGLGVFLLAALTDVLDGYLARRRQQITRLGKLLDPAADKILTSAAFISLVEINPEVVPAWIVATIVAREFAVTALRAFAAAEGIVIAAGVSGKVKTAVQVVSISLLIFYSQLGQFSHLAPLSLWVVLIVSLYSGAEYFIRFGRLVLFGLAEVEKAQAAKRGEAAPEAVAAQPPEADGRSPEGADGS